MASFARRLSVPYEPEKMFDLVDRVEDYPQFLPWCVASEVMRGDGIDLEATLHLRRGPVGHKFTTANRHDRKCMRIDVRLARGPLSSLVGAWTFNRSGGGCMIEFTIDYAFSSRALDRLLGPLFATVYDRMVDAFGKRADEVYGDKGC